MKCFNHFSWSLASSSFANKMSEIILKDIMSEVTSFRVMAGLVVGTCKLGAMDDAVFC